MAWVAWPLFGQSDVVVGWPVANSPWLSTISTVRIGTARKPAGHRLNKTPPAWPAGSC